MSSIGRKEGMLDGLLLLLLLLLLWLAEVLFAPMFVEEFGLLDPGPEPVSLDWLAECWEMFGRLKSSKTSARRGWWKWMYVAEESLDCGGRNWS